MNRFLLQTCFRNESFSTISKSLSGGLLIVSNLSTSSRGLAKKPESRSLDKALRILHLITPKTSSVTEEHRNHLRLIQDCIQDLSQTGVDQCFPVKLAGDAYSFVDSVSTDAMPNMFDESFDYDDSWANALHKDEGSLSLFVSMHKGTSREADETTLSWALSSCGSARALRLGIQLHSLAIKTGLYMFIYVGSALISSYGKCGRLGDAYRAFEEMPVKNIVSWTAIIDGFAQHLLVETCMKLYHQMRCFNLKPNDFTFVSLLRACTGCGSLRKGRTAHCQAIHMGFCSFAYVANALISMYSKCGNIKEAFYVFEELQARDIISWNSMIAGYALHGLAEPAISLLKDMEHQKIQPDAITFLCVLSSCRHVGLVEQGRLYFNSMLEHGVRPDLDHYSCIVDLLGRAGFLEEAQEFVQKMPIRPNAIIWGSLLSSSRLHGNVWVGIQAAESRLLLEPGCAATHVQLANLYASVGYWDEAARVRKLMKDRGLKSNPGYSWIEIGTEVYRFKAEDKSNARVIEVLAVVDSLVDHMRSLGYEHVVIHETDR
ncbi:pentatricopeptide repeat-containing protein At2g37320 [Macadamia integrifolia]|uniref:pentatricopeptide repeat-containing protein At2g37320 n=1 Tax=Macadamia integrifolia TaxID=60698 RepID=UPI001C4EC28A|nr:pentatricopeptide repeat-containing protein At2g37320 [Macadamia integrifolia]